MPEQGGAGEESPAPPSRLHNFNLKSWGKQRHLRARTTKRAEQKKEKEAQEAEEVKEQKEERRRFSVSLSKEEIEEDVYAMKGTRPARRPKKRPRAVQRQIDTLFPGSYLSEITLDTYKVVE